MLRCKSVSVLCWAAVVAFNAAVLAQLQMPPVSVYLEDSPAAQDLVEQAQRLRAQGRVAEAVAVYQQVLDHYPRKLMAKEDTLHTDAARWVRHAIAADEQLLDAYRRLQAAAAQRALHEAMESQRPDEALGRVTERYSLCRAGLDSGLWLAAIYLESANALEAGAVLDELADHPDLQANLGRWHLLQAATGLYAGQPDRYETHTQALSRLGERDALAQIESWAAQLHPPQPVTQIDSLGPQPTVQTPQPLGVPLWTLQRTEALEEDLAQAMKGRVHLQGQIRIRGQVAQAWRNGNNATPMPHSVVPTAYADRLFVADIDSVISIDRSSGRQHWAYRLESPADPNQSAELLRGAFVYSGGLLDYRSVYVEQDRLTAVVGVLNVYNRRSVQGDDNRTRLVSLDPSDGRLRWHASPEDLDPSLEGGDFRCGPVGGNGQVYVIVTKGQRSGFRDTYMLAVDTATGRLVWRRHLFSVTMGRGIGQHLIQTTMHGSRIFVSDSVGNAACLQARNGSIRWLTVLGGGDDDDGRAVSRQVLSQTQWLSVWPVVTHAGVIIARAGQSASVLLDPDTGRVLRPLEGPLWADGGYAVSTHGGGVLLVGASVSLLDGVTLKPRWTKKLGGSLHQRPAGLAAVMEGRVLIPTEKDLVMFDLSDGKTLGRYPITEPGNVLALPDQVVIAGPSSLRGYLVWERAYAQLTEQILDQPNDPAPGLALAHVAMAVHKSDAVMEGIDQAIAAMTRYASQPQPEEGGASAEAVQRQVFEHLLDLSTAQQTANAAIRKLIFNRLAMVTAGPQDEVAYHLAIGSFFEAQAQPANAVDHYQTVLSDSTLSAQMHYQDSVRRQAGIEAKARLTKLVDEFGPQVYARYEAEAAQQLLELTGTDQPDVSALIELARKYWLSRTAPMAMLAAGEALAKQGNRQAAIGQLRRAYRHAHEVGLVQRIVGLMVKLYEASGRPRLAVQWLRRVRRDYPGLNPMLNGRPVPVSQWLAQLEGRSATDDHLPRLNWPLGDLVAVPGRLLTPTAQDSGSWARDVFLTATGGVLRLYDGDTLKERWSQRVQPGGIELLSLTDKQVLLWLAETRALLAIDTRTGQFIWHSTDIADQLQQLAQEAQPPAAKQAPQDENPQRQKIIEIERRGLLEAGLINDDRPTTPRAYRWGVNELVVAVTHSNGVVVIDRQTGKVLWQAHTGLDWVSHMVVDDEAVAFAGGQNASGRVVVLDCVTGESLASIQAENKQIEWLGLSDEGLLIYAVPGQVVARDLRTGQDEWGVIEQGLGARGGGWVHGSQMLMKKESLNGTLVVVKPATGQVLHRHVNMFPASDTTKLGVVHAEDQWHLVTPGNVSALDDEGRLQWRDAIYTEDDQARVLQLVGKQVVAVLTVEVMRLQRAGMGQFHYTLYLLDRASGEVLYEHKLQPLDQPIDTGRATLLENRVVLTTGAKTWVISGGGGVH